MNKVPYIINENSLTIFWEGKPYTLRKDHVNFNVAKSAILEARYDDLGDLLDIAKAVEDFVQGDVEVKDEVVYYKGHRLHGVVVDKLLEMLRAGMKDSAPLVNFITRLQSNPSANSVNELYSFMSYKSLPNTPEGKILGYKGVQSDFWSNTGNADTIVLQGQTNERHQIFNGVGETIEVARRCVDDNKDHHCSFGLHIGSYDYANNWAGEDGRLLIVEFDPEDAVSVPTDCDFQKLRVSKYRVVSDITDTRKELDKPVYEANKPIYGSNDADLEVDYDEDYDEDDYVDEDDSDFEQESTPQSLFVDSDEEPIINGCGDDSDDDYDFGDADDEPEVILPEGYDDPAFDGDEGSGQNVDKTKSDSQDMIDLAIKNYVQKKFELGIKPTIKNIADLKICRNNSVRCKEIGFLVEKLGFQVEDNSNKIFSDLQINGN
ncbi:MAG: hypothetical protein CBC05_08775 [Crocinitomicaceae bacterium TMED45]|nr:MAG: hypothetical protein CBC05_08775 [Crocinitomicaceae bacterium TMED45]|tara:strand:- start:3164 stop:4462 length:1299 start_codon:yes stop_codon:yes gene_type:complete